jgi:SpoVK/Ycf46/Vps4 family AAA+-type ATPase
VEIHPTTVQKELIGAGEREVHEAFEEARKKPSIIIIDEADGVLSERMLWEPSYARTTLKQFLDEMDGLRTREGDKIFVVACSNEPWKIAEPAKGPGRLGIHIYVPPPNLEERERLLGCS